MIRPVTFVTLIGIGLSLAACGGGGDAATSMPTTTTKQLIGVVGGTPGALTLAGSPITISGPVTINGQPATAADVKLGAVATAITVITTLKADGPVTVSSVDIDRELRGPVDAVDLTVGTITLLGQTATIDAHTEIEQENPDHTFSTITLADIAVGDFVDVSGVRDAAGNLTATRIEREQIHSGDPGFHNVEFRGVVASLDTTAKTFTVGAHTIDYSSATVHGTLANGSQVEVHGTSAGTTITATRVEVHPETQGTQGHSVELEGMVSDLNSEARTFKLFEHTVDYSAITPVPTLENGARVQVEGVVDQTDAHLVHATALHVEHQQQGHGTADTQTQGQVTSVDSGAGTFTVDGTHFWTDGQTVVEKDDHGISFAHLAVGDLVEVKSDSTRVQGPATYATRIEIHGSAPPGGPTSGPVEVEGVVEHYDATAHAFTVNGHPISTTGNTAYQVNDEALTADQFFGVDRTGQHVVVKGTGTSTGVTASKVEVRIHHP